MGRFHYFAHLTGRHVQRTALLGVLLMLIAGPAVLWAQPVAVKEQLQAVQRLSATEPNEALQALASLYDSLPADVNGRVIEAFAQAWVEIHSAQASYLDGETQLQSLLDRHSMRLSEAQVLRIKIAKFDFVRRGQRNEEALIGLNALAPQIEAIHNAHPDVYGQWLLIRASIYHNQTRYDLALADYIEALRQFEAIEDGPRQTLTLNRMGTTLLRADDPQNALRYFERAQALLDAFPDDALRLSVLQNLGIAYQNLERIDDAIAVYEQALSVAESLGRPLTQAQGLLNIGTIYFNDGRLEPALTYYQRSLAISEQYAIDYGVLLNRMNIGQVYIDLGQYDNAEAMITMALEQATTGGLKLELRQIYGLFTDLYRAMGDSARTVEYQDAFIELNEEIFNESRDQALAELRIKYERDLQDERLAVADAQLARQQNRNRLLSVILVLSLGITAMGVGMHQSRMRSLRTLYEKNRDLMDCQLGPQPRHAIRPLPPSDTENGAEPQSDDQLRALYKKLWQLMQHQALYRDPALTVSKLATAAHSNRFYVSAALSRFGRGHFPGFVNGFRIQEARRLLAAAEAPPSMLDLIERCGFSSRSAFYVAFKREVGMSPSRFRAMALKD